MSGHSHFEDEMFVEFAATRDPALRDKLITAHLGLAQHLARRFINRGEPLEDLVQVASIGLVKSVDRFDPQRGVEFSTFAASTILGELKRHFRDKGWAVKAPRRIQELYLEIGHTTSELTQKLRRAPTVNELAEAVGVTMEAVVEAMEAGSGYQSTSLESLSRSDQVGPSPLGEEDGAFRLVDERSLLTPALAKLAKRERIILQLRFGAGLTQAEIANRIGVSQMHVSRLLSAIVRKIREQIELSN